MQNGPATRRVVGPRFIGPTYSWRTEGLRRDVHGVYMMGDAGSARTVDEGETMSGDFAEAEWRILRELKPVLLDRLCTRIMDECRAVMDDGTRSAHERYLALFQTVNERNEDVAMAFDDMRRSRAAWRLAWMRHLGLFHDDEWERFSPGTRDTVQFLAGEIAEAERRQRKRR